MKRSKKELLKMINGRQNSQIVSTAARLGVATAVGKERTLAQLEQHRV